VLAALVLLLLGCANLANLLLARGRSREYTLAVHVALGAGPGRLIAMALIESVAICVAGAGIAVAAVAITSQTLLTIVPPLFVRYAAGIVDLRVLGVTLLAALACATAAAVVPAVRLSRVDVLGILPRGTSVSRRSRSAGARALLVLEAAIGTALVLSGIVVFKSFTNVAYEDLGYQPENLYMVSVRGGERPPSDAGVRATRYRSLLEALAALPGVQAAAGADSTVASGQAPMRLISKDRSVRGGRFQVTANYFETIGTQLVAGRAFMATEVEQRSPVAILSVSASRHYFPGAEAAQVIGRSLSIDGAPPVSVVGVVPDFKQRYGQEGRAALFLPLGAEPSNYPAAVVKMQPAAKPQLALWQERLTTQLGYPAMPTVTAMPRSLDTALQDPRFRAVLFGVLSLSALLLAAVGLYAVSSFEVAMRRREIGVRMALGAARGQIQLMVIRDACRPVLVGIGVGMTAAFWWERLLGDFMYGVEPRAPGTYLTVLAVLLGTAVLTALLPARRAAALDPVAVLRSE